MLCSFLLYSGVILLYSVYIYIHILFFLIFISIMVYHRILNIVLCAIWKDFVVYTFYT